MPIFGIHDIISKIGCTVCTEFTAIFIISLPEIRQSKQRGEIFMKKKAVVLGLVGAMALGTCTVSAANGTKNISATFRNIKIVVDGKELSTSAEPFIYNGTTYLPIRAVGEAVGKEVTWNGGTNTVYLGEVPASAQQQTPAPETPAPAASSSLPILSQYAADAGASKEEIQEAISMLQSGQIDIVDIHVTYINIIDDALVDDNIPLAKSAYAEAQIAFGYAANDPDYASVKENFEEDCKHIGLF